MIENRVEESLNNPGTAVAVQLTGATSSSMRTFLQAFGAGVDAFYYIEEGALWETGIGNVTAGPPVMWNRNEVLDNSARNKSRMNFTGAAKIYNYIPASYAVHKKMLDAETAARAAAINSLQASVTAANEARTVGDANLSAALGNESRIRAEQDASLRASINSVEQVRSTTDANLDTAIRNVNNARVADDAYYRNLQVADDNYYRNLQVSDDNAIAAALRSEMGAIPGSRVYAFGGVWDSQGARIDTVWETAIFGATIPYVGIPILRVIGSLTVQVYHPPVGAGGGGENAQIVRAYLIGPAGNQIHPGVAGGAVWATVGQYSSLHVPVIFEGIEIPAGSHIRLTAERAIKEGGGTVQLVSYTASGFCVTAR